MDSMRLLVYHKRALWLVIVLSSLVSLIIISGCEKPPLVRLQAAKGSILRAVEAKAKQYAPDLIEQSELFMHWGQIELAKQNGRLAPFRNYRVADSLLRVADSTAYRAEKQAIDSVRGLKNSIYIRLNETYGDIASMRNTLDRSIAKLNFRHDFYMADMAHKTSKELYEVEQYEEAIESLYKAEWALGRIEQHMEELEETEAQKLPMWRNWVNETLVQSRESGSYAIIVDKTERKTYLVKAGRLVHTYSCDLGYNSGGQKMRSGDGATPEGRYHITAYRPRGSKYYKALNINYPNETDRQRFAENKRRGIIPKRASIGGLIELHGHGGQNKDWTDGCVALTNREMDHIMQFVRVGTPVTIVRKSDQWP